MTVLVTGGCGYIGAHVVHALHQAGEKVVVVDDLSYGKPTRIEGSRLYGMDIAAPGAGERFAEILDAEGVDSVIHFASQAGRRIRGEAAVVLPAEHQRHAQRAHRHDPVQERQEARLLLFRRHL